MIVHDWTKRLRSINDILRYAIRNGKNSIHIKSFPLIYSFNIKVKLFQRVMKKIAQQFRNYIKFWFWNDDYACWFYTLKERNDLRTDSHYTIDLLWNTGFGSSFVVTHVCAGFSLFRPPGKCLLYLLVSSTENDPLFGSFHGISLFTTIRFVLLKVNALDQWLGSTPIYQNICLHCIRNSNSLYSLFLFFFLAITFKMVKHWFVNFF